jgi:hypothetical protein
MPQKQRSEYFEKAVEALPYRAEGMYSSPIQANASQMLAFDDGGLHPKLRGTDGAT